MTPQEVCDNGRDYDEVLLIGKKGKDMFIVSSNPDPNAALAKLALAREHIIGKLQ